MYDLVCVVNHSDGSVLTGARHDIVIMFMTTSAAYCSFIIGVLHRTGHYTTHAQRAGADGTAKWYVCDDSRQPIEIVEDAVVTAKYVSRGHACMHSWNRLSDFALHHAHLVRWCVRWAAVRTYSRTPNGTTQTSRTPADRSSRPLS